MLSLLMLVVCLLVGCTLQEPLPPVAPPGPDDLSTWTTPELLALEPPERPRLRPVLPPDPKPTPAEKVYPYVAGGTYSVPVAVGAPLDIQFARGESVHQAVDSDRRPLTEGQESSGKPTCQRWCLEQGKSGAGDDLRAHLFVTVTEPGLRNGLTITTTRGSYAITLESVKQTPIRYLRWTHAREPVEVVAIEPSPVGPLPNMRQPTRWRVGYAVASTGARRPDWVPRGVFDDGKKVYVVLPPATVYSVSPLVRKITTTGPAVVNGRQYLHVLVVDELAAQLELRVGTGETAEIVTITRGALRIVDCPGDQACPVFPTGNAS